MEPSTPPLAPGPYENAADVCAREQIQIPGAIQPHGILFVLDENLRVLQVSANVGDHLGIVPDEILGRDIRSLVETHSVSSVEKLIRDAASTFVNPFRVPINTPSGIYYFDGIAHFIEGTGTVLELEEDPNEGRIAVQGIDNYLHIVQQTLREIGDSSDVGTIAGVMAREIQGFTGFDRVMVYRFAEDFHGEVVGEALHDGMESYLGQRFPASDIPAQARALYRRNLVRLLRDVDGVPAPLVPVMNPATGGPLDMSRAVLRAMSPVHIQYLKNMEVASSLSISLIVGGRLWGLIACHHSAPRFVSYSVRATASLYAIVLSAQLEVRQHSLSRQRASAGRHLALSILNGLRDYSEPLGNLKAMLPLLKELFGADGAALLAPELHHRTGLVPGDEVLTRLAGDLSETREGVIITQRAPMLFPSLAGHESSAAGIVAIHLGGEEWLIMFRQEIARTVRWAGDPRASKDISPDGSLNPRRSFKEWLQRVDGESEPWPEETLALTTEVRSGILEILRQRNLLLLRSNQDLQRFAGVVAHEVKNYLQTGIMALSVIGEHLERSGNIDMARVAGMGSNRLTELSKFTNDMLSFAGSDTSTEAEPVDLRKLTGEVADDLKVSGLLGDAVITVGDLPTISGPPIQIRHVISNLIRNALVHGRVGGRPLHITVGSRIEAGKAVIFVKDDGKGVPEAQRAKVFDYFYRGDSSTPGTGIGLAFCAQIIHRMRERIWFEAGHPSGAVFLFTADPSTDGAVP